MVKKCLAHVLVFGLRTLRFYQNVAATVISEVVLYILDHMGE